MTAADKQPLAVLGGTFDPIHYGHLRSAVELRETFSLACVRLMPCAEPPHRLTPNCSAADRAAMVELAIVGEPGLSLDKRELARVGPSYTFDSLTEIRAEIGPVRPLCIAIGGDAVQKIDGWHRWQELLQLAHIIVMARPGWQWPVQGHVAKWLDNHLAKAEDSPTMAPAGSIFKLQLRQLDISASEIRSLLTSGRSAGYLLPDQVLTYIKENSLYDH